MTFYRNKRKPQLKYVSLQKHAKGQDLLKRVCEHLNLLEEDYFGLAIWDNENSKVRKLLIM